MKSAQFKSNLAAGILVAFFFSVALCLRVIFPYDKVFVGNWIKFTGSDAYLFMRIVDNLVHNFPHLNAFDPYLLYPTVPGLSTPVFWPYLLATVTWLIGIGSPTPHTIDVVSAYLPAILGALTTIPVYFIGKTLFNRWAGIIAAGLVAISPGEFLGRSILGFTDYHVAETLFTTIAMMFLILAVKAGQERQLTFRSLYSQRSALTKPVIYSILTGLFLGIYFLTWAGALLFVFIIFSYLVLQFIIDHLKGRSTEYLCFVSTIVFVVSLLMSISLLRDKTVLASLAIAIVAPIILALLSYFMARRNIKPLIYPASLVGLGILTLIILRVISPAVLQSMNVIFGFFAWPIGTTVLEMQPLLFPNGNFSWAIAWGNFTTGFFISIVSLIILIYLIIKRGETEKTAFVVWSLIILAATLAMRRFAYYFVVNVALLTSYLCWLALEASGFNKLAIKPQVEAQYYDKKARLKSRKKSVSASSVVTMSLTVIAVFFIAFFPNIGSAVNTAGQVAFAPSDAWYESLTWLKDNTPEPFGNPDFYYQLYKPTAPGKTYEDPKSAYGVTAWWDYGYWITRIGHRIPTSNPGTGHNGEAYVYTAQDEASSNIMNIYDSKYLIVDHDIVAVDGKFHALATLSGSKPENFYDIYYQVKGNKIEPVLLYYPEYYRTIAVHLYYFDGRPVNPAFSIVIAYQDSVTADGQPYKQITEAKQFDSYAGAKAYISSQKSGNYRIVGNFPNQSPVPLPALEHYKLAYSSQGSLMESGIGMVPEVKIFEYTK
jgi:oligosaccharyl transferase (archaeosortase A-associated)